MTERQRPIRLEDADTDGELCVQLQYINTLTYGLHDREEKSSEAEICYRTIRGLLHSRNVQKWFNYSHDKHGHCATVFNMRTECRHQKNSPKSRFFRRLSFLQGAHSGLGVSLSIYSESFLAVMFACRLHQTVGLVVQNKFTRELTMTQNQI